MSLFDAFKRGWLEERILNHPQVRAYVTAGNLKIQRVQYEEFAVSSPVIEDRLGFVQQYIEAYACGATTFNKRTWLAMAYHAQRMRNGQGAAQDVRVVSSRS